MMSLTTVELAQSYGDYCASCVRSGIGIIAFAD